MIGCVFTPQAVDDSVTLPRPRIHLDPVIANLRPHPLSVPVEDNQIRILLRHVTVYASARRRMILEKTRSSRLVTTQTFLRKMHRVMLHRMHIMASHAGHGRSLEAAAPFEQFDLVPVDVACRARVLAWKFEVICDRFSRGHTRNSRRVECRDPHDTRRIARSAAPAKTSPDSESPTHSLPSSPSHAQRARVPHHGISRT